MCIGTVGTVTRLDGRWAEVDFGGVRANVRTDFLSNLAVGERVLIHAGFAISRLGDDEARKLEQAWSELRGALARRAAGEKRG